MAYISTLSIFISGIDFDGCEQTIMSIERLRRTLCCYGHKPCNHFSKNACMFVTLSYSHLSWCVVTQMKAELERYQLVPSTISKVKRYPYKVQSLNIEPVIDPKPFY